MIANLPHEMLVQNSIQGGWSYEGHSARYPLSLHRRLRLWPKFASQGRALGNVNDDDGTPSMRFPNCVTRENFADAIAKAKTRPGGKGASQNITSHDNGYFPQPPERSYECTSGSRTRGFERQSTPREEL